VACLHCIHDRLRTVAAGTAARKAVVRRQGKAVRGGAPVGQSSSGLDSDNILERFPGVPAVGAAERGGVRAQPYQRLDKRFYHPRTIRRRMS